MRYEEFKTKVKNMPLISGQYLELLIERDQTFKNQLTRWRKNGKIIKLKRDFYVLNDEDRKINPSRLFMACEIYRPSYVSLEYALSFYGIIPEKVADITCIAAQKTLTIENAFGRFVYQHIKADCFAGFLESKDETGLTYYMATPEKAAVDFIYLNKNRFSENFERILTESFRFQNLNILDTKLLLNYGKLFKNKKLMKILKTLRDLCLKY